jgi:hypothetical protein
MTVKFFDGLDGTFTTFTTKKQTDSTTPYRLTTDYFMREVNFNFTQQTYTINNLNSQIPLSTNNWYEYKNPPTV